MIRNTVSTILLAATVTAAALTQATYVRAATKFDGNWSVVVYTRSGPCDAAYRFSGQIVNGVIVYNGGLGPDRFRRPGQLQRRGLFARCQRLCFCRGVRTFERHARCRELARSGLRRALRGQLGSAANVKSHGRTAAK